MALQRWCWASLVISAVVSLCHAQTIKQIIESRPDLSEFRNFIRGTAFETTLRQENLRYTLFAPDNDAMRRLLKDAQVVRAISSRNGPNRDPKSELLYYHTVQPQNNRPLSVEDISTSGIRAESNANDALKLYLRTYQVGGETRYYVNGAQILVKNIDAANGRIHIIDSVLYPAASKSNAFSFIDNLRQNTKESDKASMFNELIKSVQHKTGSPVQYLNSDSYFVTIFVPTDESIKKVLNRQRFDELLNDEDKVMELLCRHIIVDGQKCGESAGSGGVGVMGVYHGGLLNDVINSALPDGGRGQQSGFGQQQSSFGQQRTGYKVINALLGEIKPMRVGNTLYVSNVCGMVKVMDVPMRMYGDDGLGQNNNFGTGQYGNNNNFGTGFNNNNNNNNNNNFGTGFNNNNNNNNFGTGFSNNNNNNDQYENNYNTNYGQSSSAYVSRFQVTANITVNNGVVHMVDGLMGYIYNDAMEMIDEDNQLDQFRDHVRMSNSFVNQFSVPGSQVPNRKYTIFAPVNSAFENIKNANIDLTQNQEELDRVLNMHILDGQLSLSDLSGSADRTTLEGTENARFISDRYGTHVEVGRIRATIVRADVCVKNGIIHYIDRLLGVPYQNMFEEIETTDSLLALKDLVDGTPKFVEGNRNGLLPLPEILKSPNEVRTLFAPDLFAFNKMRSSSIGRYYTNEDNADKLYFLLLRHLPQGETFIEDNMVNEMFVPNSDNLYIMKEGQDYFVEYRSGEFGNVRAKIMRRNQRLTNGVVHIIDTVLFIDNISAFETIGSGSFTLPSIVLVITSVLSRLLL